MELLSKGKRYKEIAHLEGMSISGVAQRVERIKNKFGVARRLEALAIYLLGQRH